MDDQSVILAVDGAVATVTLNRPDKLNSFTAEMHARLRDALDRVADDPAVGALVITGAGRGFCAGQDLADPALGEIADGIDLGVAVERDYNPMIRRIAALPLPVIAAVNGVAAGAGANLALAADIVLAARGAKFVQSFAAIGLIPDTGGSYHLPRLIGQARALGLALTGDPLSAEQAADWGLIWRAVDDDALAAAAASLAARLAAGPRTGLAAIKAAIRGSGSRDLDGQLDYERDVMRRLGASADFNEAVDAFLNKRKPVFRDRREG